MQKTGIKLFAKHIEQYTPQDPMYEEYADERGRKKRRKVRLVTTLPTLLTHVFKACSPPWTIPAGCQDLEIRPTSGALSGQKLLPLRPSFRVDSSDWVDPRNRRLR